MDDGEGAVKRRRSASETSRAPKGKRARTTLATDLDVSDCVTVKKGILTPSQASKALASLRDEVTTTQGRVRVYGKTLNEPRLTAYHVRKRWAPAGVSYVYSGKVNESAGDFTPTLEDLCCSVEDALGMPRGTYTVVLVNEYRDGKDHISWHSDDERMIDGGNIASLSLGATRDFKLRSKADNRRQKTIALESGDLVHMHGACQALYQHQVPKRARAAGSRLNLTFRRLVSE